MEHKFEGQCDCSECKEFNALFDSKEPAELKKQNEELKLKLDAIEELVVDARRYGAGARSWGSFRNKIDSILKGE